MRKTAFLGVVLAIGLFATGALAQEGVAVTTDPVPAGDYHVMVVGGQMSMGMAHVIGDNEDAKPRFAGGGLVYFDYYLSEMLALEGGIGMVGKGSRDEGTIMGTDYEAWAKIIYLEIPLGVKLNIQNFRIGAFLGLYIGLTGKLKTEAGSHTQEDDWEWDHYKRFNLGPKISLGYAIPVGPVDIVPGLDWSLHLLNEYSDMPDDFDDSIRAMNLMFNVAVEFGF